MIRLEHLRLCLTPLAVNGVAASLVTFGEEAEAAAEVEDVVEAGGTIVETAAGIASPITVIDRIFVTSVVVNASETGAIGIGITSEDGDHPRREGVGHLSVGTSGTRGMCRWGLMQNERGENPGTGRSRQAHLLRIPRSVPRLFAGPDSPLEAEEEVSVVAVMTGIGAEEGEVGISTMTGIDTVVREVAHRKDDGGRMTVSAGI